MPLNRAADAAHRPTVQLARVKTPRDPSASKEVTPRTPGGTALARGVEAAYSRFANEDAVYCKSGVTRTQQEADAKEDKVLVTLTRIPALARNRDWEDIATCPVTLAPIFDPVVAGSGASYERIEAESAQAGKRLDMEMEFKIEGPDLTMQAAISGDPRFGPEAKFAALSHLQDRLRFQKTDDDFQTSVLQFLQGPLLNERTETGESLVQFVAQSRCSSDVKLGLLAAAREAGFEIQKTDAPAVAALIAEPSAWATAPEALGQLLEASVDAGLSNVVVHEPSGRTLAMTIAQHCPKTAQFEKWLSWALTPGTLPTFPRETLAQQIIEGADLATLRRLVPQLANTGSGDLGKRLKANPGLSFLNRRSLENLLREHSPTSSQATSQSSSPTSGSFKGSEAALLGTLGKRQSSFWCCLPLAKGR